jgi:serine/threonine protein kinase
VTATQRAILIAELVCGVLFLHSHEIVHDSLRPCKLLMHDGLHVRINGWATNELIRYNIIPFGDVGDMRFVAPELGETEQPTWDFLGRSKSDIYSLGFIIFGILDDRTHSESDYPSPPPLECPHGRNRNLHELLVKCCDSRPDVRPTIDQIWEVMSSERFCFTGDVVWADVMRSLQKMGVAPALRCPPSMVGPPEDHSLDDGDSARIRAHGTPSDM